MWHVSVGNFKTRRIAKRTALKLLAGYGDEKAGQWLHQSPGYVHVRRRLTADEQRIAGEPRDIRGTAEENRRAALLSPAAFSLYLSERASWWSIDHPVRRLGDNNGRKNI